MPSRRSLGTRVEATLRRHWPALALVALALLLRLVGALPLHYYGDDAEYATVARSLAGDPTNLAYPDIEGWGPHPFVSQPPLLLYLFAAGAHLAGGVELGAVLVTAVLGAATAGVVYGIGVELDGRAAGSLAALFVAVLPTHVTMSGEATLDAGLSFFFALSVLFFIVWTRRRTTGWALATGAAAAAATFSKLYGFLVYLPLLVGFALVALSDWRSSDGEEGGWRNMAAHLGWAGLPGAVLSATYLGLLAYLEALVDLQAKIQWQLARVSGGGAAEGAGGGGTSTPWHWYLTDERWALQEQMGLLMALAALVGLAWAAWRTWRGPRSPAWAALALWPVAVVGFFSLSGRKIWFYVLPALPGLAALAALGLAPAVAAIRDRWSGLASTPTADRASAVAAALLVASLPVAGPAMATHERHISENSLYGYGVKEAAHWIDDQDPDAGQVGTLLGRFTLHFYNEHRTYHSYVPDHEMDRAVREGEISYVVMDNYLRSFDQLGWMQDLVDRHDGELVKEYSATGYTRVKVYELRPGNGTARG